MSGAINKKLKHRTKYLISKFATKCQAASEEGDFSVIYGEGTMTEQFKKRLCERCGTMTGMGFNNSGDGQRGAAGAKTLANVIFMAAHCPVYLSAGWI